MSIETMSDNMYAAEHSDSVPDLFGRIKGKLITGAYDVLKNHHEYVLEISTSDHHYEHLLTRDEAERLDRAVWSAGEDMTLENLLHEIQAGLERNGMYLNGNRLDITLRLKEASAEE